MPHPGRDVAIAEKDAVELEAEETRWAKGLASLIRSGAARLHGRRESALTLASLAERDCLAANMDHYLAVARLRRGRLLGGQQGQTLIEMAQDWMRQQAIRNPERMSTMLAPGN
jgi:eukaryotic-like serine/threonine-protein kinase